MIGLLVSTLGWALTPFIRAPRHLPQMSFEMAYPPKCCVCGDDEEGHRAPRKRKAN